MSRQPKSSPTIAHPADDQILKWPLEANAVDPAFEYRDGVTFAVPFADCLSGMPEQLLAILFYNPGGSELVLCAMAETVRRHLALVGDTADLAQEPAEPL